MKSSIERRIAALEVCKNQGDRMVHFIKAADVADRNRQMAELLASGKVGPRKTRPAQSAAELEKKLREIDD